MRTEKLRKSRKVQYHKFNKRSREPCFKRCFDFRIVRNTENGNSRSGLATVLSRVIEVIWCILETAKKDSVKLRLHNIIHDDKLLRRDFWKYTSPVLGNEIVWGVGFTMYSVIMGHLGSDAVAANSIANIAKNSLRASVSALLPAAELW